MTAKFVRYDEKGLSLRGLDGSNPLGFLAALGLLKVISACEGNESIKMLWRPASGTWIPDIVSSGMNEESLLELLSENLVGSIEQHPLEALASLRVDNNVARKDYFRQTMCASAFHSRTASDWLAALASDVVPNTENNQLQTVRRDYFRGNIASVLQRTTRNHLRRAIFRPWDYLDALDNQSLHWDPSEDRRHAYQWNKPAGDPDRKSHGGMLGANRLALEALAWFYSLPQRETLRTIGFWGHRSYDTRWTWPIWNIPLTPPVVHSLLMMAAIQEQSIPVKSVDVLKERGIAAVFRTDRILVGKTPNFTPARNIM